MHLIDVVATYLYVSLDKDIHMKIPKGFTMPEAFCNERRSVCSIKLQKIFIWVKAIWSNVV